MAETISQLLSDITSQPIFYLLSFVIIISALMVVSLKNIFHCALFLVLTLFAVAGIFVLLQAEFLAAVQVLLYVGAVSVLMIFAIMLTSQLTSKSVEQTNENATIGFFISAGFLVACLLAYPVTVWKLSDNSLPADNIFTLGRLLMTDFVLPFEVVSVLLLAALIGAVVLARREKS